MLANASLCVIISWWGWWLSHVEPNSSGVATPRTCTIRTRDGFTDEEMEEMKMAFNMQKLSWNAMLFVVFVSIFLYFLLHLFHTCFMHHASIDRQTAHLGWSKHVKALVSLFKDVTISTGILCRCCPSDRYFSIFTSWLGWIFSPENTAGQSRRMKFPHRRYRNLEGIRNPCFHQFMLHQFLSHLYGC